MEIRNVSNAQNFGMALKIKQGAEATLRQWDENKLARLTKLGEELKDHKYVDVVVNESGDLILDLKCANKYRNIDIKPSTTPGGQDMVQLKGIWEGHGAPEIGTQVIHSFQFRSPEVVRELIDKTAPKHYYDEIEKMGTIAKAFEDRGIWHAEQAATERARVERVNHTVGDLIGRFGTSEV